MCYFISGDLHLCLDVMRLGDSRWCYSSQTVCKQRYYSAFHNEPFLYPPLNSPVTSEKRCCHSLHLIETHRLLINDVQAEHMQTDVFFGVRGGAE